MLWLILILDRDVRDLDFSVPNTIVIDWLQWQIIILEKKKLHWYLNFQSVQKYTTTIDIIDLLHGIYESTRF